MMTVKATSYYPIVILTIVATPIVVMPIAVIVSPNADV